MNKRNKFATLAVVATTVFSSMIAGVPAHAESVTQEHVQTHDNQNWMQSQVTPASKTQQTQSAVQATPAIGATTVRPDQSISFQFNTQFGTHNDAVLDNAMNFFGKMDKLASGVQSFIDENLVGYIYDGKTLTKIPSSDIQFDAATHTVTMKHAALNRYTQYAAILQFGDQSELKDLTSAAQSGNQYTDIVTKVDVSSGTVTLLGHGVVQLTTGDKDVKPDTRELQNLKPGNLVQVHTDHKGQNVHFDQRHEHALTTLFTTGSAIGEATQAKAAVSNSQVSVLNAGTLDVTAMDDYGDPATNATLTVSGQGSGNSRNSTAFSAQQSTAISNGTASVQLADHTAETVNLSYSVKDNTYSDAGDTHSGAATEQFTPGPTAKIDVKPSGSVFVGKTAQVQGEALDTYGNSVVDGTAMKVTATQGTVGTVSQTQDGNFNFAYTAPTKKGNDALSVTAGDSSYNAPSTVYDRADHPAKVTETSASIVAGKTGDVKFNVSDQYGNLVENDESLTLSFANSVLPSQTVNTNNGVADFSVQAPTKVQNIGMSLSAGSNGFAFTDPDNLVVQADAPVKASLSLPSALKIGQSAAITGQVTDQYSNPAPKAQVDFGGALTGSLISDEAGTISGSLKVAQSGSVTASVGSQSVALTDASGQAITTISAQSAVAASQFQLTPGKWTTLLQDLPKVNGQSQPILAANWDSQGRTWVLTGTSVFYNDGSKWVDTGFKGTLGGSTSQYISKIKFGPDGTPYIDYVNTIYKYVNGAYVQVGGVLQGKDFVIGSDGTVYGIDHWGRVDKFTPNSAGINYISSTLDYKNGDVANAVVFDKQGHLLVGWQNAGIVQYDLVSGTKTQVSTLPVWDMKYDRNGVLTVLTYSVPTSWAPSGNANWHAIYTLKDGQATKIGEADYVSQNLFHQVGGRIFFDYNNTLYIAGYSSLMSLNTTTQTMQGVLQYPGNSANLSYCFNGLMDTQVDSQGNIWLVQGGYYDSLQSKSYPAAAYVYAPQN